MRNLTVTYNIPHLLNRNFTVNQQFTQCLHHKSALRPTQ